MKSMTLSITALFMMLITAYACGPKAIPAPSEPRAEAPSIKTPGAEDIGAEWDNLIKAAKKEKRLLIYSTAGPTFRSAIIDSFGGKYGIETEFVQGRGGQISEKLISEHKAGIYLADVYVGGSTTSLLNLKPNGILSPLEPLLLLPEVLDGKYWQTGGLNFVDKDRSTLNFSRYVNLPLIVNDSLVKRDEVVSFRDLLNPRWKGKIVLADPTIPGGGLNWFSAVGKFMMGFDYMKELAKQDPLITSDQRQQVEWVARGKVAISNPAKGEIESEFVQAGAPLRYVMPKEGAYLSASSGNLSLINKAPHPQAAKVFINWLLTREGQTVASRGLALPSVRNDVPTDHLDPNMLLKPGQKYYESDSEEFILEKDVYARMAREIFVR